MQTGQACMCFARRARCRRRGRRACAIAGGLQGQRGWLAFLQPDVFHVLPVDGDRHFLRVIRPERDGSLVAVPSEFLHYYAATQGHALYAAPTPRRGLGREDVDAARLAVAQHLHHERGVAARYVAVEYVVRVVG